MALKVALPAFFDLVALLDLDDAAAPVGHRIGDHDVLDDAGLQAVAQFEDRRLADGGVDADLGGHAADDQVRDPLHLEDRIQVRGVERAFAGFVHHRLAGTQRIAFRELMLFLESAPNRQTHPGRTPAQLPEQSIVF